MSDSAVKSVFFPNLNGLRFIAAALVMLGHIEQWKGLHSLNNMSNVLFFDKIGSLGVTLFFVLSGFLITYLLLSEQQVYGTIHVKKFYLRRVFRIWPLYYLLVILGLFVLPHLPFFALPEAPKFLEEHYILQVLLFFLILPNISNITFPVVPYLVQTWSIGVEEQFYLIWPLLIKYFRNYIQIMVFIICFLVLLRTGFLTDFIYYANRVLHFCRPDSRVLFVFTRQLSWFFYYFRIGCMAIGGIGAWLLFYKKEEFLALIYKKSTQIGAYIFVIYMCAKGFDVCHEFYAFFFVIIILNLASNKGSILKLENPVLDYLGKISYGIYMYHMIALTIAIKCIQLLDPTVSGIFSNVCYYLLSFVYTIAIASLSYYLFENQFLKLKKVFASVKSAVPALTSEKTTVIP